MWTNLNCAQFLSVRNWSQQLSTIWNQKKLSKNWPFEGQPTSDFRLFHTWNRPRSGSNGPWPSLPGCFGWSSSRGRGPTRPGTWRYFGPNCSGHPTILEMIWQEKAMIVGQLLKIFYMNYIEFQMDASPWEVQFVWWGRNRQSASDGIIWHFLSGNSRKLVDSNNSCRGGPILGVIQILRCQCQVWGPVTWSFFSEARYPLHPSGCSHCLTQKKQAKTGTQTNFQIIIQNRPSFKRFCAAKTRDWSMKLGSLAEDIRHHLGSHLGDIQSDFSEITDLLHNRVIVSHHMFCHSICLLSICIFNFVLFYTITKQCQKCWCSHFDKAVVPSKPCRFCSSFAWVAFWRVFPAFSTSLQLRLSDTLAMYKSYLCTKPGWSTWRI